MNTICAACGSHNRLNSAAGLSSPKSVEPPITTIRSMRGRIAGSSRIASARFVNGPVATTVTGSGVLQQGADDELDASRLGGPPWRAHGGGVQPGLAVEL